MSLAAQKNTTMTKCWGGVLRKFGAELFCVCVCVFFLFPGFHLPERRNVQMGFWCADVWCSNGLLVRRFLVRRFLRRFSVCRFLQRADSCADFPQIILA